MRSDRTAIMTTPCGANHPLRAGAVYAASTFKACAGAAGCGGSGFSGARVSLITLRSLIAVRMSLRWLVVITPRLLFLLLPVFLKDLEALLERKLRLLCPDALGLDALVRKDLRA